MGNEYVTYTRGRRGEMEEEEPKEEEGEVETEGEKGDRLGMPPYLPIPISLESMTGGKTKQSEKPGPNSAASPKKEECKKENERMIVATRLISTPQQVSEVMKMNEEEEKEKDRNSATKAATKEKERVEKTEEAKVESVELPGKKKMKGEGHQKELDAPRVIIRTIRRAKSHRSTLKSAFSGAERVTTGSSGRILTKM